MPIFRKDGKSILFVHVPKCGGSSIEAAFRSSGYESLDLDGKMGRWSANYLRSCTPQHMHADLLERLYRIERFDAVFMLVRDPIARFRSEYVWRNRKKARLSPDAARVSRWTSRALRAYRRNPYAHDNHIRPQYEFLLPQAIVYRFEDGVGTALADLNERFDLGVTEDPAPRRSGAIEFGLPSADVELTAAVRGRVIDFYRRDFDEFGYVVDTMRERGSHAGLP